MRRLLALAAALGALAASAPTIAQGMALADPPGGVDALMTRCPTAAEVTAISADLSLSFEYDPTAPSLVCTKAAGSADLTELGKSVYQALIAMEEIPFARPLPWTALTPYRWLVGAIDGIRFRQLGEAAGFCCQPAGVIHIDPDGYPANGAWINPQSGSGLQGLPSIFTHEARHAETGPHTCGNNDQTIAELGAFGVTYYLALWEALYTGSYLDSAIGSGEYTREATLLWTEANTQVAYCNVPSTDLELTGDPPRTVASGSRIDWGLVAQNVGPAAAPETYLYVDVPTGARLVSATPSAGSCTATPADDPVVVGCALGSLAPLASVAVEILLQPTISAGPINGGVLFAARVTGSVRDPLTTNNAVGRTSIIVTAGVCPGTPTSGGRIIRGTSGNDVLAGTRGGDVICGFEGTDVIRGRGGNDLLSGGSGKDRLIGGAGRDRCLPGAPGFRRGDTATGCERTR